MTAMTEHLTLANEELRNAHTHATTETTTLRATLAARDETIATLQAANARLQTEHDAAVQAAASVATLQATITAQNETIATLSKGSDVYAALQAKDARIAELTARLQELEASRAVYEELEASRGLASELEATVQAEEAAHRALRAENEKLMARVRELEVRTRD